MAYLQDVERLYQVTLAAGQQYATTVMGLRPTDAYASYYPQWETITPQYPTPSPYTLAQLGYRTNELAYACIDLWAQTTAEPPLRVYNETGETDTEVKNHRAIELLHNPCPGVSEQDFWKINEIYLKIAGFSCWEIERSNSGEPLSLWPMRPDWCSFLRGEGLPRRAVRYQPYGMPYMDIPIENLVIFSYFDPLYPLLKPISPTIVAQNIITLDNDVTRLVTTFIENGAFLGGLLSVNQTIKDDEAQRLRERWRQYHSGPANAGDIAVLGEGAVYTPTTQTFREMVFPELDARNESRICMAYHVKPILVSAKVGLGASTYSNYEQARKAWYEEEIFAEWRMLEEQATLQILRQFDDNPKLRMSFDISKIKALQEDQDKLHARARDDFRSKILTQNEARELIGKDAVEDGDEFDTAPASPFDASADGKQPGKPQEKEPTGKPQDLTDEERDEAEKFHRFAEKRIKAGQFADIPRYEFKTIPPERQAQIIAQYTAPMLFARLDKALSEDE